VTQTQTSPLRRGAGAVPAAATAALQLVLTSAHHLYGAWRFDTPWRAHVAHIAMWLAILLAGSLAIWWRASSAGVRRSAAWVFAATSLLACGAWLGLFEGGYNHGLKAVLGLAGVNGPLFDLLFPPSIYEPPGDLVFEVSGVLQLPAGLVAGHFARAFLRGTRESN